MLLLLLACFATDERSEHTGDLGCDDVPPAVCVSPVGLEGDHVDAAISIWDDATLMSTITCSAGPAPECCSYDIVSGTYTIRGTYGEETVEETGVEIENSHACDHDTTQVELVFDVAR